jgi:hypothetical protein
LKAKILHEKGIELPEHYGYWRVWDDEFERQFFDSKTEEIE